jgi:hypothetical protein
MVVSSSFIKCLMHAHYIVLLFHDVTTGMNMCTQTSIFLPAYITNAAHSRMKLETKVYVLLSLNVVTDMLYSLSWNYMITT